MAAFSAAASTLDWPVVSDASFAASACAPPLLRLLDAETAHRLAVWAASVGLVPRERRADPPSLRTTLWGRDFPNPLGLAAGFDKDGVAVDGLLGLGFGFVEIGSVTPQPQEGNPKPRVFRLPDQRAVINRYGFNSGGADAAEASLLARRKRLMLADAGGTPAARGLLGVNLGKNKETQDAAEDYCAGVRSLGRFADYLVINVSSPNTPGLRSLQGRGALDALLARVQAQLGATDWGGGRAPPLLLKIAPDLSDGELADVAAVAARRKLDGIVVGNTTVARPPAVAGAEHGGEAGGLSGVPLFAPSTAVLAKMYALTRGRIPLIGCGGVASGAEAYAKIRAGASLVQVYTAFAFDGPPLVARIKAELADCLAADGFACVSDAVGAGAKTEKKRR